MFEEMNRLRMNKCERTEVDRGSRPTACQDDEPVKMIWALASRTLPACSAMRSAGPSRSNARWLADTLIWTLLPGEINNNSWNVCAVSKPLTIPCVRPPAARDGAGIAEARH